MQKTEIKFDSSRSDCEIKGRMWKPDKDEEAKGIVQITHGMGEHIGRYDEFATYLVSKNYIVCAIDNLGHGESSNGTFGYMGDSDGYLHMLQDMHRLYMFTTHDYEHMPYILFGHSMGSFLARNYVENYGDELNGVIFSGTGEQGKNIDLLILLCKILIRIKGGQARGSIFTKQLIKNNLKQIPLAKTHSDWLTHDETYISEALQDKKANFEFTYAAYLDLFYLIKSITKINYNDSILKELPTYIFSGLEDPIGHYGASTKEFYDKLVTAGAKDVTLKLYDKGRHEMLHELNRAEVFEDTLAWIDRICDNY